jgi:hypothetical protein
MEDEKLARAFHFAFLIFNFALFYEHTFASIDSPPVLA